MRNSKGMDIMKKAYNQALLTDQPYALIAMNIKKFRFIEYTYGTKRAAEILSLIMEAVKAVLNKDDVIVYHDDDNFILLKAYTALEQLEKHWLVNAVDAIFDIEDRDIFHNIYTSFGIFLMNDKSCPFETAYDRAEFCRKFSRSIKSRVFSYEIYKEEMKTTYMQYCQLEVFTAKAKTEERYLPYIQPKVSLKTRKIIGGEMLMRLPDGKGGMIPIAEVLPILNKNGFVRVIDLFLCDKVVKEMAQRQIKGKKNVRISFNISNSFFYSQELLEDYCKITDTYHMDPKYLEMEFMETIKIDADMLKEHIQNFHEKGFSCALDDFGNGFSNYNLLCNSKLDTIKLDRCFFGHEMTKDTKSIVKMLITMIQSFGMHVIAEGVERKEDVEFLTSIGCDAIQGYYFYKPMPLDDFFQLLDKE
ncbi:EAL domain-containing protein [[Clostridium] innocuum]|nr:EAL domain-containing protein [[Clostridium] innocuum]